MQALAQIRSKKPASCPDQSIYAQYACGKLGLSFSDLDGGSGQVFSVASTTKRMHFAAGRCSWYPQNNATAATLASDKYFTNVILERAGVATLGGDYFFLHERHRTHRPNGHEIEDALKYFARLGQIAFVKPLMGSRGDFAQAIHDEAILRNYIQDVSRYYDAIVMQPLVSGDEYRIFLLDEEVLYAARKHPPFVVGDGARSIRDILIEHNSKLNARGLSPAALPAEHEKSLNRVLLRGERWEIPGRMNLSAGGKMVLEPASSEAMSAVANNAVRALGLRVAAVDLFTNISGEPNRTAVIEVNSNPSIRILEESGRADLILRIWHHTFSAMELL
jgi:glutathione synthase/RimK-type ligase-like ATP-grasp enzyme